MNKKIEETEWFKPQQLDDEDLAEIGLDSEELARLRELAEQPELENFDVAHAR